MVLLMFAGNRALLVLRRGAAVCDLMIDTRHSLLLGTKFGCLDRLEVLDCPDDSANSAPDQICSEGYNNDPINN